MKRFLPLVLVGAVTVLLPSVVASAVNTKLVHSSICRAQEENRQDDLNILYNGTGALTVSGGDELVVKCPLLTDFQANEIGLESVDVYVDPSTSGDGVIACDVACRGVSGGLIDFDSATTSGSSAQTLALDDLDSCVANAFYVVTCDLDPGGSPADGVFAIRYAENVP